MYLTIRQASDTLGKTQRQIRYLIQQGELKADKREGRWMIDSGELPLSAGQRAAMQRRETRLRETVEDGLGLEREPKGKGGRPAYSIRDLKAFQYALPIHADTTQVLGAAHPAAQHLRQAMDLLGQGCHRFERSDKASAYRGARDAISAAVVALALEPSEAASALQERIESELLPALAGLIRRLERRQRR